MGTLYCLFNFSVSSKLFQNIAYFKGEGAGSVVIEATILVPFSHASAFWHPYSPSALPFLTFDKDGGAMLAILLASP